MLVIVEILWIGKRFDWLNSILLQYCTYHIDDQQLCNYCWSERRGDGQGKSLNMFLILLTWIHQHLFLLICSAEGGAEAIRCRKPIDRSTVPSYCVRHMMMMMMQMADEQVVPLMSNPHKRKKQD
jgi:hypothetical protein